MQRGSSSVGRASASQAEGSRVRDSSPAQKLAIHTLAGTGRLRPVDRALIQFICVRKTHLRKPPVDPSSPFNVAEEGGWAYCPGGEPDGHKWFKTGGITRAALDKFEWPDEEEAEP
jgi:hypothetical protein